MAGLLAGRVAFGQCARLPKSICSFQWHLGTRSAYSRGGGCGFGPPGWVWLHRIPCSSVTPLRMPSSEPCKFDNSVKWKALSSNALSYGVNLSGALNVCDTLVQPIDSLIYAFDQWSRRALRAIDYHGGQSQMLGRLQFRHAAPSRVFGNDVSRPKFAQKINFLFDGKWWPGCHRNDVLGQIVNRLVQSVGAKTVVIDNNLKTIQLMRRFGYKGFFGDPQRPDLLHAAGIKTAHVLVVAVDDPIAAEKLVKYARRMRPDIHIVARAQDRTHTYRLYQAGADDIVRELFDSSLRAGRYVLENIGLSEFEASEAERLFYHHDRHTVRELALLWDPEIPSAQNEPYIARARELEKELEASLLAALEASSNDAA